MVELATEESWPPRSARHALLSSPSGRKRYADSGDHGSLSPRKRAKQTPSLTDRLRLARKNDDQAFTFREEGEDDDDDDEETLKLKLAAIEAKLKLKKLQSKARNTPVTRPASSTAENSSQVEISLSPARRQVTALEPKSPSRVLLGIDKGIKGADISLRRAPGRGGSPHKHGARSHLEASGARRSRDSGTDHLRKDHGSTTGIKSFSERMSQVRDDDRKQSDRRHEIQRSRTGKFQFDAAEVESFKKAAEASLSRTGPVSSSRSQTTISKSSTQKREIEISESSSNDQLTSDRQGGDASLFEGFSGLHLSNRILPHSFLKRTLPSEQFTTYRIPDLLKHVVSPAYEIPEDVGDYVVFGVVASKSSAMDQKNHGDKNVKTSNEWQKKWDDGSQNRKKFMVFTLTDLTWTVDLYLFDTALPRYYRLMPGTVVAILNPSIMRPKPGRENTGAFSLAIHDGDDTVLEIGTSKDLGHCNAVKKDGKECGQWVNAAKTEICEWHLNAQIAKAQARRMGVNTGANRFGGNGARGGGGKADEHQLKKLVRGYDWEAGQYFISSSTAGTSRTPLYKPNVSSAHMLDLDDDDPFVAEGQFSRDKAALLRKRMAGQERERAIARRLAQVGSGDSAGANYMRRKGDGDTSLKPDHTDQYLKHRQDATFVSGAGVGANKNLSENLRFEIGKKRTAENVRLSPVKKTRFLTSNGIKIAGRASMGPGSGVTQVGQHDNNDGDDDDDELDII